MQKRRRLSFWQQRVRLAITGIALGILIVTLAGAWVEARWPNAAGTCIIIKPQTQVDIRSTLWQLRRIAGVRGAVAVFQGELATDEVEDTGWLNVWFYANQADNPGLEFVPPDLALKLWRGRLPEPYSLNEAILGYELAQTLRLRVGDTITIRHYPFRVVGIWNPSAHLPGNFAQVSAVAAETFLSLSPRDLHHFVVLPAGKQDAMTVARRIWHTMPDMQVLSPDGEIARIRQEHIVLIFALSGAAILALLLSQLLLHSFAPEVKPSPLLVSLLSAIVGLGLGWLATFLANGYAKHTLGLTPLQITPRLVIAVLAMAVVMGLLARRWSTWRWSWSISWAATALVLALCTTGLVAVGALSESLNLSLSEAQRTAADWVTIAGVQANAELLHAVQQMPGVLGYVLEAYGGPVSEDEQRWLGRRPPSGVFYSVRSVGGEGTLSVPYWVGYWRGRALNPDDPNEAVIGYDLAHERQLNVGDAITVRGVPLTIVGIRKHLPYDPRNDFNYRVDISLEALRRVLHDPFISGELTLLIPPARSLEEKSIFLREMRKQLHVNSVSTIEGRLAEIARGYPAAWTLTRANAQQAIRHAKAIYAAIVILCGLLLLTTGALAVTATMTDRLVEDERRISLLKALGADEGLLFGEYLQKATVLGIAGALCGVLGGWLVLTVVNMLGPSDSAWLLFTPRLGAIAFFLVALVAMIAAVAPASRAARQDAAWTLYASSSATAEVIHGGSGL